MQVRLDTVNRVLREQITGNRVIRAFVRDDYEKDRFREANDELTEVSLATGRLLALMFPIVMTVVNISSIAVVWFGAHRIDSGGMQIGALTAFLAYLMQIVMSVMMATFMFMMVPRAEVCAERIEEVLDTDVQRRPADRPVTELRRHGHLEIRAASEFRYPGAEEPVLQRRRPGGPARRDDRGDRVHGQRQVDAARASSRGCSTRPDGEVLVDGVDVADLDPALLAKTVGLVPQKPYLFSGTVATNLRYGNPDATDEELWHALEVAQAKEFVERLEGGLDAPIAQGGTQCLRRSAAAARDRADAGAAAGDLPLRRLLLRARLRHGRGAAGGARPGDRRGDRRDRRPAGVHHPRRRPDRRPGRGPGRRHRHATTS